jgi:hypothetical protein
MTTAAISESRSLADLLRTPGVNSASLSAYLDSLDEAARVREVRTLGGSLQKKLWNACADAPAVTLDEFVPASLGEGQMIVYSGKNSLPVFSLFEKRFARFGGAVIGYNHGPTEGLIGPGFFTVTQGTGEHARELLFNYDEVPAKAPEGWPMPRSNMRGVSRLVFGKLHDYVRRVATGVVIGIGTRQGKPMNAFFVLARAR